MDSEAILALFDEQIRRNPEPDGPEVAVERDELVVRAVSTGPAWIGVTWSELDESTVDEAIAAQVRRFAPLHRSWEWKHYSYDRPASLPARLLAAGFVAEPPETLMVAEIAELALDTAPPEGVRLVPVTDRQGIDALVQVGNAAFGGSYAELGEAIANQLAERPESLTVLLAMAGGTPVAAGRIEFGAGTDFASIWGGGTVPDWRRRGVFRSLVAYRAALAAAAGYRYLQVDASPQSRPILQRLGFVSLAVTTPFVFGGE